MENRAVVCFLWSWLSNRCKSSWQSGWFLCRTTTCRADQSFYIFPLVSLAPVGRCKKATAGTDMQRSLQAFFLASRYVGASYVDFLLCSVFQRAGEVGSIIVDPLCSGCSHPLMTACWQSKSTISPDGHPNSPTSGHLKFPHPEGGVTMV
jgi:hypothetical protein